MQGKRKKRKRENKPDSKPEGKEAFSFWALLFVEWDRKTVETNLDLHLEHFYNSFYYFIYLPTFCPSLTLMYSLLSPFYTLTSSLWGSVLIEAGMSAVVQWKMFFFYITCSYHLNMFNILFRSPCWYAHVMLQNFHSHHLHCLNHSFTSVTGSVEGLVPDLKPAQDP